MAVNCLRCGKNPVMPASSLCRECTPDKFTYVTDIGTFRVDPAGRVYDEDYHLIEDNDEQREAMRAILRSIYP